MEELGAMPKNQKSANEDFFLTDENDGYNSYGLKAPYAKNHSDTPVVGLENLRTALLSRLQEAIDGFD